MKFIGEAIVTTLIFILLTAITQIGGIVYFFQQLINWKTDYITQNKAARFFINIGLFLVMYLFASLWLTPKLASSMGREALPIFASDEIPLKPNALWVSLCNRHYVTTELKEATVKAAQQIGKKYPGVRVNYLDACFPFGTGFPLLPHLSHDDGEKLDVAFIYKDKSGKTHDGAPTWLGYGASVVPKKGELDQISKCVKENKWYSFTYNYFPNGNMDKYLLDESKTKQLVAAFSGQKKIKKIFLEPHLRRRLGLNSYSEIKFHGCHAVRHDDHIHVEL